MTDFCVYGAGLLKDWQLYKTARPREQVFDIQSDKDELCKWAHHLHNSLMWDLDANQIAENCYQFESRLLRFKDKIIIEILTNGSA
jgi:hypothetical protein